MSKWLPSPFMSATLFAFWLLVNQSASAGNLVLALIFAIALPRIYGGFRVDPPRIRRPLVVIRLGLVVLYDIVVSNIEVARRILGPESRLRSAFVWVPLDIRDPHGIAALAGIITMTPGTLSSDLADDCSHLLVHALNVDDEQALIDSIKQRYEAPLREIFE
jgi:multicomponent K+:H+ antiporter subunit E